MKKEVWKPIPNYENIYEASNLGRIRTFANKTTYTNKHGIRHWKQRVLKQKYSSSGYRVCLWKDGKCKDWLVHRLIGITFLGESSLTINHIDGNRFNNKIENLEWCSLADNIRKGFEAGLYRTQIKVVVTNKQTHEKISFRSMSLACKFMNKSVGYLTACKERNKYENENYKWKLY